MVEDLVRLISAALAAHDPLDPWLVQSNYDDRYWDDVATRAACAVATAESESESESEFERARAEELADVVELDREDGYGTDRVRGAAAEIWSAATSRVVDAVGQHGCRLHVVLSSAET